MTAQTTTIMACCKKPNSQEEITSQQIDAMLKEEKKKIQTEVKLLLLGAGESGKSTFAKQMKIIHLSGWNEEERKMFTVMVHANALDCMRMLTDAIPIYEKQLSEQSEKAVAIIGHFRDLPIPITSKEVKEALMHLWADPIVLEMYARKSELQLYDSAKYFLDAVERITQPDYIPTYEDILRTRVKTTGIAELNFELQGLYFRVLDVGGQRSERRKWIRCFEDVMGLIYLAAISDYDIQLREDIETNRMLEAVRLFREVVNSPWFEKSCVILFLNKTDLFQDKIKTVPLTVCFPEYKGSQDFKDTSEYIKEEFMLQCENQKKLIYVHFTCATDTTNITKVFSSVKHTIIETHIKQMWG